MKANIAKLARRSQCLAIKRAKPFTPASTRFVTVSITKRCLCRSGSPMWKKALTGGLSIPGPWFNKLLVGPHGPGSQTDWRPPAWPTSE
jgi:hypothetical protein